MPLLELLNWVITLPAVGRIHEMPPTERVPVLVEGVVVVVEVLVVCVGLVVWVGVVVVVVVVGGV